MAVSEVTLAIVALGVASTLGLFAYSLALLKFFKGGLLYLPLTILTLSFPLFASGKAFDTMGIFGIGPPFFSDLKWAFDVAFVVTAFYGIYSLYKLWERMGRGASS